MNVSQAPTEQLLDEGIAGSDLIEVRWDHRVTALGQSADELSLTCHTVAGEREISGRYVLVCAGVRCDDLLRQLGLLFDGETFDDQFLICDIRTEIPGWQHEPAVMVDTFRPLELGEGGRACDDGRYAWTWSRRGLVGA